ncbi:nucleoside deaminase [Capnocytophaga canimorsus]|uniref:tRNA-specific adenosine deaminase n=2 Tax=Capnocytophaga canimorsus TaxID=28188 RepID=F9YU20_CAPCC|nr:nucleoside deaminase [Capnocytophaga canimorsus]AEK24138.1 tRNA-specific adenosine deaminase [Capnocytophaga canimorsus Cc5]ATA77095.1 tRNA-specific adenosine deaminase [Capnocytophaga canimorsus]ATA93851.1 tRNA-specific adenosine deaminase [Capnocytophaga canimorsus]PJI83764.1 tRNA(adenine34) deaminase [Capnocytophaga canimorsus]CEN37385.1 tRNA-specific adenosine deaminase [Capnocytophaga canimorsus]
MNTFFTDEYFMKKALEEAQKALEEDEIPVGAIITTNNQIIAKGYNLTQKLNDVTAHAEIQAITAASGYLGGKYLKNCTLYVTLEPCIMCAGALFWSQISRVVFAADDPKRGFRTVGNLLHPKTEIQSGVLQHEATQLLHQFFNKKRK